mmetsp:Transcript_25334/g.52674  ORF Transcript_25334/g.52674 Transcript_25334/m.52674 type:complete len:272 (-) Transcript_25334:1363-2178(-)
MCWESCMSYVLWDVIPILERRGYYNFATDALEVLLFGKRLPRATTNKVIPDILAHSLQNSLDASARSYRPLLSRRARGKGFDRLIIDYTHLVRKHKNAAGVVEPKNSERRVSKGNASTKAKKKVSPGSIVNEVVTLLTEPIIRTCVPTGQISFSSIRTLARRLKRPLSRTLKGLHSFETSELGHRLSNDDDDDDDDNDSMPVPFRFSFAFTFVAPFVLVPVPWQRKRTTETTTRSTVQVQVQHLFHCLVIIISNRYKGTKLHMALQVRRII